MLCAPNRRCVNRRRDLWEDATPLELVEKRDPFGMPFENYE